MTNVKINKQYNVLRRLVHRGKDMIILFCLTENTFDKVVCAKCQVN